MDKPLSFIYEIFIKAFFILFDIVFPPKNSNRKPFSSHLQYKRIWNTESGKKSIYRHIEAKLRTIPHIEFKVWQCGEYHFEPLKHLIWSAKYENDKDAVRLCAEILSDEIVTHHSERLSPLSDKLLLVHIPSTTHTRGEKDYDHMKEISKFIKIHLQNFINNSSVENALSISVEYSKGNRNLKENKALNRRDRIKESKGKFKTDQSVKGQSVVLIDDITTTGSSMRDCVRALNESGAIHIYSMSIAH